MESDELTSEQIAELSSDLLELRGTLTQAVAADEEASKPVTLDQSSVGRLSSLTENGVHASALLS